jgi:hypothetical protein
VTGNLLTQGDKIFAGGKVQACFLRASRCMAARAKRRVDSLRPFQTVIPMGERLAAGTLLTLFSRDKPDYPAW